MTKMIPAAATTWWINVSIEGARQINSGGSSCHRWNGLFVLGGAALAGRRHADGGRVGRAPRRLAGADRRRSPWRWAPACSRRSSTSPRRFPADRVTDRIPWLVSWRCCWACASRPPSPGWARWENRLLLTVLALD